MDGRITDPDMGPMPIMAGRIIGTAIGGIGNRKARSIDPGFLLRGVYRGSDKTSALGKMMANDDKTKAATSKKEPAVERKASEAAPKTDTVKTDTVKTETAKTEPVKTETVKAEGTKTEGVKPDATPSTKGMGEGQKPVTQAYKDNWNAIFAKKKKR
jgi:hypothetical protein